MFFFIEENEENIFERFSSILLSTFLYYTMSYYLLNKDEIEKPGFFIYLSFIILHISHILLLKFLHYKEEYAIMWIVTILPLVIYIIYSKYITYKKKKDQIRKKKMEEKLRKEKEDFESGIPNRKPQQPDNTPSHNIEYVGLNVNNEKTRQGNAYNEMKNTVDTRMTNNKGLSYNPDDIRGVRQIQNNNITDMGIPPSDMGEKYNLPQEPMAPMGFDMYAPSFGSLI